MGESSNSDFFCGPVHCSLAFTNARDFCRWRFVFPFFSHVVKQLAHIRYHRNFPRFPGSTSFQSSFRLAIHSDDSALEVTVSPSDMLCLGDAESAESEKPNQFRARLGMSATTAFNF